jgi:hypothetical protein
VNNTRVSCEFIGEKQDIHYIILHRVIINVGKCCQSFQVLLIIPQRN